MFCASVLVSEQTEIISVAKINLSDFYNRDGPCLLRNTK